MYNGTTGGTRRLAFALALAAFVLSGCAATGGAGAPAPSAVADDSDYVPGTDYHMIMAEIASQRGVEATAAEEYLSAAENSDDPEVSRRAAEFAFDYGFDAYALRAARRWSQLEPEEASARLHMARLLIRRNDLAGAVVQAEAALGPAAERTAEDYQLLGDELAVEDNAEAVTRLFSRLLSNAPDTPALRLALGAAALRSRDLDLAVESARRVLAAEPTGDLASEAHALTGRALFARGDTEAALAEMAALAKADATVDTEVEYAAMLASADRQVDALAALDDITARYGAEPEVRRLRGLIALDGEDLKTAWDEFSSLVDDSDFADEACFYLAGIAVKQQRFDQALQLFARVGEEPYLGPAQDAISRIAEASGDSTSALTLLTRFAQRYPRMGFDAARYRAAMLQRLHREQEALDLLNQMVIYRPDDASLLLARGELLEKMGRVDPALADLAGAVRILPDSAFALNSYGYTLANRTRHHDEAYRLIRRAIERESRSGAILDSYGWVLYKQGSLPAARSYLALAQSELSDPEVAAHLGEVMWKLGEKESARQVWADALEKDPSSNALKDTMARFVK